MQAQAAAARADAIQRSLRLLRTRLQEIDTEPADEIVRLAADLASRSRGGEIT
jgi:hypothetical protein